jgi:esterase/lipase superfamily enzyme
MKREYHKWYCHPLGRDMELLSFGLAGARIIAFPTRCGRFYDYENMGIVEALRGHFEHGWLQMICVDSIDQETFYCNWCSPHDRIRRHLQFESYILNEVLPLSEHLNPTPFVSVVGCSFGAYHAMNIALRHPSRFNRVVAMSGRYDLTVPLDGFRDLFDGHYDTDVYFNTPSHFMTNVADHGLLAQIRQLDIKLIVGEHDPFLQDNRRFSEILSQKGVWHLFRVWNGRAHGFRRWREMIGWFV